MFVCRSGGVMPFVVTVADAERVEVVPPALAGVGLGDGRVVETAWRRWPSWSAGN